MADDDILSFPCDLPIKVLGRNVPELLPTAVAIVKAHLPELEEAQVTAQESKHGRFVSLTIRTRMRSREQADAVYRDLVACELVMMVL